MFKVLVTGTNSFIGNHFSEWVIQKEPNTYQVDFITLKNEDWKTSDWSHYDSILHVAGIAHVSSDPKLEQLYYQVNRDLAIQAAKKAKNDGVGQFIFLSSIIIFGSHVEHINKMTQANPDDFYGDSKLQAEKGILPLANDDFKVAIVRPPMVYGPGAKGNFPLLVKMAKIIPLFPDYENKRSMIYIDNLCEFLRNIIDWRTGGVFHPQNNEYVKTSDMVRLIGELSGKKIYLTKLFNPFIILFGRHRLVNKVFGNLYYEDSDQIVNAIPFEKTIELTLRNEKAE